MTLLVAAMPCVIGVAFLRLTAPAALAAPPPLPPRAPPPQLVLPTAERAWIHARNSFDDGTVPVLILPAVAGAPLGDERATVGEPTARSDDYDTMWWALGYKLERATTHIDVLIVVEMHDCIGPRAVFRVVESMFGELDPAYELDNLVNCKRDGDRFVMWERDCTAKRYQLRRGELITVVGSVTRPALGWPETPLAPSDLPRLRRLVRATTAARTTSHTGEGARR